MIKRRKERTGVVLTNKMDKSIIVRIDRTAKHPTYRKIIKRSSKVMAHDEKKQAKIGDRVKIQETAPMSKTKRWRLIEVLK
ncbi:MAG: 30S ribosomal protein S17 [Candidatus Omnitrophica bacterium]|nr:30S ribosomal protein S17 [Candidatus Omnitrophota bacterium]